MQEKRQAPLEWLASERSGQVCATAMRSTRDGKVSSSESGRKASVQQVCACFLINMKTFLKAGSSLHCPCATLCEKPFEFL